MSREPIRPGIRKQIRDRQKEEDREPDSHNVDCPSVWMTDHASDRMRERFGTDLIIPYRTIQKVGLRKRLFEDYYIRRQDAVFVCKRLYGSITIKTVLVYGAIAHPNGELIRLH
jgi:hypothetical protein